MNEPYSSGPGGEGQYTHKVYHVGRYVNRACGSGLGLDPDQCLRIRIGSGSGIGYGSGTGPEPGSKNDPKKKYQVMKFDCLKN